MVTTSPGQDGREHRPEASPPEERGPASPPEERGPVGTAGDDETGPGPGTAGHPPAAGARQAQYPPTTWAAACHLSALAAWLFPGVLAGHVLGPLVVWLLKRGEADFVDRHGREAVNFQLSWSLYALILLVVAASWGPRIGFGPLPYPGVHPVHIAEWPLRLVTGVALGGGWLLILTAAVAWHVLVILAAYRASNGEPFRYPLTIRWFRE